MLEIIQIICQIWNILKIWKSYILDLLLFDFIQCVAIVIVIGIIGKA